MEKPEDKVENDQPQVKNPIAEVLEEEILEEQVITSESDGQSPIVTSSADELKQEK